MSADFVLILGDRPLSEPDRLQNEFERPLARPDPYRRNPSQADLPTVVRKLDLASSRTPTAFRGTPCTQDRARPTPDGPYLKHLAQAARATRNTVPPYGGHGLLLSQARLPSPQCGPPTRP